jgi:hypothetical protein
VLKLAERYAAAGLRSACSRSTRGAHAVGGRGRVIDALDESRAFDLRRAGGIPAVRVALRAFSDQDVVLIDTPDSRSATPGHARLCAACSSSARWTSYTPWFRWASPTAR